MSDTIQVTIGEKTMEFQTEQQLFSPAGADRGTLAMLSAVTLEAQDKLLDLGCGYGLVGIWAAKTLGSNRVVMSDIQSEAVSAAKENALRNGVPEVTVLQSDGFAAITDRDFTKILSNPPYHENFSVPKGFIEEGWKYLQMGGRLYMVTKRRDWYYNKLCSVFGGAMVKEIDGYYVFVAEKRAGHKEPQKKEQKPSRKLQRKMNARVKNRKTKVKTLS